MQTKNNINGKSTSETRCVQGERPKYTAAVRHADGSRELLYVLNAQSMADARALVLAELGEVQSLLIALCH